MKNNKPELSKCSWVFWFEIRYRPNWFSRFWKNRGANFKDYQIWKFHVSIGRPWLKAYEDAYGEGEINLANAKNFDRPFSLLIINKQNTCNVQNTIHSADN